MLKTICQQDVNIQTVDIDKKRVLMEVKLKEERISEKFIQNLLLVMPNWHSKLIKPFKEMLNREMSLETYYCLETLKLYGTVTMTQLAQEMKVTKQQLTRLVDKLSEHQFVERTCDPKDRRAIWLQLTPRAISYLDNYYKKNTTFIQMLEEQLTDEELQKLNQAVETLGEILPKLQ